MNVLHCTGCLKKECRAGDGRSIFVLPKIFVLNRVSGLKGFGGTPLPRLPLSASWFFFPKAMESKKRPGDEVGVFSMDSVQ